MKVKGTAILSTLEFIELKFGKDAINKIREKLSPEECEVLDGAIIQPVWYPFSLYVNLTKYMDQIYGISDLSLAKEMGSWAAAHDLKTIYKLFYKIGSPSFIIKRATKVFTTYFESGELKIISETKNSIIMELVNFCEVDLVFIQRVSGFMQKTLELSGGIDAKVWGSQRPLDGKTVTTFNAFWK